MELLRPMEYTEDDTVEPIKYSLANAMQLCYVGPVRGQVFL